MNKRVSVIIPCYNGRDYVGEAIESALAQDGAEIEVIVVDDGSTDGTREILEGYGDRIRRIDQDHGGAGRARNAGIAAARGDYIAFLDCDDLWQPGKIKKQLDLFEKRPELGLVYTDAEFFNEKGVFVRSKKEIRPPAEGRVLKALFQDNFITTSSVMIRRICLEAIGKFREDYRNAQDYDLWLRLAGAYSFGYVDEVLVQYRLREGRLSERGENRYLTDIAILTSWIRKMPELFPEDSPLVRRRLSRLYLKLGRRSLKAGERTKARRYLLQGLRQDPRSLKTWLFLGAGCLPLPIVLGLKKLVSRDRIGETVRGAAIFAVGWVLASGLLQADRAWSAGRSRTCLTVNERPPVQAPDPARYSQEDTDRGFVVSRQDVFEPLSPTGRPPAEPVLLSAAPGEFEPITFSLYPLKDQNGVIIHVKDLVRDDGKRISAEQVQIRVARDLFLPERSLTTSKRPQVCLKRPFLLMPEPRLDLRSGEARRIRLTVAVPENAASGRYISQIEIGHEGRKTLVIPFHLIVYPFRLDPPPIQYLMLFESSLFKLRKGTRVKEKNEIIRKAEIVYKDMREHGMTAVSFVESPIYELGPDGRPQFPLTRLSLEMARKVGLNGMPVIYIGPLARTEKKKHAWNYAEYDPAVHPDRVKRLVEAVTEWAGANGWGPIAFTPIDEPNEPERARIGADVLQAVKKVEGARTFLACTPKSLLPLAEWVDVVDLEAERYTPKDHLRIQKSGKAVWIYDNGLVLGTDPLKSRFVAGFFGWRAGLNGVTAWTYPLAGYRPVDWVTGWSSPELGSDGRPVPTLVWEAFREGVDDRRYIETLEQRIREARAKGQIDAAVAAEKALEEIASELEKPYAWYASGGKEGPYLGGLKAENLDRARERVAREIIRLS